MHHPPDQDPFWEALLFPIFLSTILYFSWAVINITGLLIHKAVTVFSARDVLVWALHGSVNFVRWAFPALFQFALHALLLHYGTIVALAATKHSLRYLRRTPESLWYPPESWTARRSRVASCRCSASANTRERLVKIDALIADSLHNMTCSLLCRLSEELLLVIMKLLDPLSIQCLRRTSRLFLRLYSSAEFSSSHDLHFRKISGITPWHQPKGEYWNKTQLIPLLQRDKKQREYCKDCRAAWKSPTINKQVAELTTRYIHCSGCRLDHPRLLFSKEQRAVTPDLRMCIAHEGFVRICDHTVLTWADMASHFPFKPATLNSTGNEDSSQVQETRIEQLVKECKEKCHTPQDHCFGPGVFGLTGTNPRAIIEGDNGREINIVLRWTGHLSLPKLSSNELGINKDVTPEVMHKYLGQFRSGVAEHIAPEMPPGRIIEMSCFEPNRCSCLHYPGANILPGNWALTPPHEIGRPGDIGRPRGIKYRTCRIHTVCRLKLLQPLQNNGDGLYNGDGLLGQQIVSGGSHKAAIHTPGRAFEIRGRATIGVTIGVCRDKYRCLEVQI